jgi:hypothetical protein
MSWSTKFDDPMPCGLATLKSAASYILKLPKAEQAKPHWQSAIEAVIMAAEDRGPLMHARIGMLRALNHGLDQKPAPRVKRARVYRVIR